MTEEETKTAWRTVLAYNGINVDSAEWKQFVADKMDAVKRLLPAEFGPVFTMEDGSTVTRMSRAGVPFAHCCSAPLTDSMRELMERDRATWQVRN